MNAHLRAIVLRHIIAAVTALRDYLNGSLYALHRAEQDANFECRCIEDGEPTA